MRNYQKVEDLAKLMTDVRQHMYAHVHVHLRLTAVSLKLFWNRQATFLFIIIGSLSSDLLYRMKPFRRLFNAWNRLCHVKKYINSGIRLKINHCMNRHALIPLKDVLELLRFIFAFFSTIVRWSVVRLHSMHWLSVAIVCKNLKEHLSSRNASRSYFVDKKMHLDIVLYVAEDNKFYFNVYAVVTLVIHLHTSSYRKSTIVSTL